MGDGGSVKALLGSDARSEAIRRRIAFPVGVLLLAGVMMAVVPKAAAAMQFPCTTCHADKVRDKLNRDVHMAELADRCETCHSLVPETSHPRNPKSVTVPQGSSTGPLCYGCHKKEGGRSVHAPVAAGECTLCHAPHRAPSQKLLKRSADTLCLMCHRGEEFKHAGHGPAAGGSCLFCHEAHHSENAKLLRKFGSALCFECHDRAAFTTGTSVHEPVGYGDCTACHAVHGSSTRKLLKEQFAEELYLPYRASNYALCFLCHPRSLAEAPDTDTTGFRNGPDNLHFLHINKGDRGRSCKACHGWHAAGQQKLVLERVPGFGSWDIPIYFTRSATGGTCVVGCHKPKTYDRLTPVVY